MFVLPTRGGIRRLPWIPHSGSFTVKDCLEAAQVFNRAAKALDKYGIRFFYHPHGYEFVPTADGTLFDLLMKNDPAS
ncbi:MAG: hypothetical protein ACLQVY_19295 [Limisphaerales bacterium]